MKVKSIFCKLKRFLTKEEKLYAVIVIIVVHAVIFTAVCIIVSPKSTSEDLSRDSIYKIRCAQMAKAVRETRLQEPEEAARVWGEGIVKRNAAMQYLTMSEELGKEYLQNLDVTAPDWVIAAESQAVIEYDITSTAKTTDENKVIIPMKFRTADVQEDYKAILTVAKGEDGFWRIAKISMGDELYVHTGFYHP